MTPIEIKQYLIERRLATLQDIAIHFRKETDTVTPMLDMWIRKGKLKKHDGDLGCQKGCCKCDPATIETYEWIA
ncbi:MAG: FeoC-like transcriptional regulator [Desulfosarcina sp.]|nr:FeoC-like transcriptional regulator [Desulfobacterales bacterium]